MCIVVEFKNFTFKYLNQSEPSLKNVNLKIKKGEKVLIAGPSGSGKSTLGYCLNGIIPFSKKGGIKGELFINGKEPYKYDIFEISKNIGTVLQDQDGQFIGLSVGEDVSFIDENNNIPQKIMLKNTNNVLKSVNMENFIDYSPQDLSGGQKQSISLAGIMRSSANILLFDEPLANLDPESGKHAMKLICEIQKNTNKTIIVIEHRIEDVLEQNFDKVIILDNGKVVANDTPKNLFYNDIFRKYGLREPLYMEALKYAGVDFETSKIYPIEDIGTPSNIKKIKNWCTSLVFKKESFNKEILSIKNLSFEYDPNKLILNNINFNLYQGEILSLLGNNGAGKSTLCKIITGIEKEKSGDIIFNNNSIKNLSIMKRGENIGFVMQNPNHMITKETLLEEVEFGLKIRKVKNFTKIAEDSLKICGLFELRHWPVSSLSYGQKKRLTIASILALNPKILILDEPTAGQDYRHYKEFMKFIKNLTITHQISIILITHDMHLALEYSNRSIVLCDGKIVANNFPSNVLSNESLMKKSSLKESSLSKMAKLMNLSPELVMNSFITFENKEEEENV